METKSDDHNSQELNATSQEAAQPRIMGKTPEGILPQGSDPLQQPVRSDDTVQMEGGAYVAGPVTNVGGVNIFGGKVTINQDSMPTRLASPTRPENYIPFPRNPLYQVRLGEFEELKRLLFESRIGSKRLGLVGMGGVGKTQLAVELAYRCLEENRFPDGIFWLTATGNMDDWRRSLAELALKTGYLPPEDMPSNPDTEVRRAQYLCRYLARHSEALLILDNVDDPGLVVSALLALIGEEIACTQIYTSRVIRTPIGITTFPVDGLPQEAALRLLLASTRPALLTEFLNGGQSVEVLAACELCEVIGYLPLALVHLRAVLNDDREILLTELVIVLREQGALEVANDLDPDAVPLIATFRLSWEKVKEPEAQRLFKLASYFSEAAPIPLWLLGLAAGLGEKTEGYTPLGRVWLRLQQLSLLEKLSTDQVRLHPLVRGFGRRLVTEDGDKGQTLLKEAAERQVSEFTNLNKLEQRARQQDYWGCLEQVRTVRQYIEQLGMTDQMEEVERIESWLDRESYLLGDQRWWPQALPGLFYQQLFNRSVEDGSLLRTGEAPTQWLRQLGRVGAGDQSLLRVFTGHFGDVKSVAFSPDGTKVLTGSNDRTARLWETVSGKLLMTLTSHTDWVRSAAFSLDGTKVLTGSNDRTARLWETASGKLLATFTGHGKGIESVTFSPDGVHVLTGSADRTARLWETASGRLLTTFASHAGGVRSVAFSPDGVHVLTGSADRTARLWETASGRLLTTLKGHKGGVRSVAFSPDGTQMLTGSSDWMARLWDRASAMLLATLEGHSGRVMGVAFSPDGMRILTGSEDHTARLWDRASAMLLATLEGHSGRVMGVAFSPDGMRILTGSSDRTARLWKALNGNLSTTLKGHVGRVTGMAFSQDGMRLLTGSDDQSARLWETASGRLLATLKGHKGGVRSVAFSPDGTRALTGSSDWTVRLWETASGELLTTLKGHDSRVRSAAFSPDGMRVLTGSDDQTARLWETANGELLATLEGHAGGVWSVVFSSNGTRVLTGSDDQTARLWETASAKLLVTLEGHVGGVRSMAFSPDGTKMLIGSVDGTARLLETVNGKLLAMLEGHAGWVMITVFSPDGRFMMTCDQRGRLFLWRATGVEMGSLLDIYVAAYEVGAVHWQNTSQVVLADKGGLKGYPHFYRLRLEGM